MQTTAYGSQYKNIVFDMGNVLIQYDPDQVTRQYTEDPELIREIHNVLFCSGEWYLLDAGLITEDYAMEKVLKRFATEEQKELAARCFAHWHEYNMWAKPGMAEVVEELKEQGKGIYILSNASLRLPQCYRSVMPRCDLYDGVMFSAEEKCLKPQAMIYERFFARFGLKAEECFFIDDLEQNIAGAKACGMNGYVFADGDVTELRKVLGLKHEC